MSYLMSHPMVETCLPLPTSYSAGSGGKGQWARRGAMASNRFDRHRSTGELTDRPQRAPPQHTPPLTQHRHHKHDAYGSSASASNLVDATVLPQ